MSTLAERIRWILDHRGFSARRLSLESGLSQSHVGQLRRGQLSGQVSAATLAAIARTAKVDAVWLQTGEGSPEPAEEAQPDPVPNRTLAARLAREDGVLDLAVRAVLDEPVDDTARSRSVLWWAWRMKAREVEMLAGGGGGAPPSPVGRNRPAVDPHPSTMRATTKIRP